MACCIASALAEGRSTRQGQRRAGLINASADPAGGGAAAGTGSPTAHVCAANAVNNFAALGTYLANLRDHEKRQQHTELSQQLNRIVREVGRAPQTVRGGRPAVHGLERRLREIGQGGLVVRKQVFPAGRRPCSGRGAAYRGAPQS
jgi:hypothetical protein